MTQITEDYVSFEIAKLLKEKGFDGECDYWYGEYGEICCSPSVISVECWCPSQSLTLKWLREVHNIHIIPYFDKIQPSDLPYSFVVYVVDEYTATREIIACFDIDENLYWSKQEQAVEAAILYVLKNLI